MTLPCILSRSKTDLSLPVLRCPQGCRELLRTNNVPEAQNIGTRTAQNLGRGFPSASRCVILSLIAGLKAPTPSKPNDPGLSNTACFSTGAVLLLREAKRWDCFISKPPQPPIALSIEKAPSPQQPQAATLGRRELVFGAAEPVHSTLRPRSGHSRSQRQHARTPRLASCAAEPFWHFSANPTLNMISASR